jgi:CRP/FNR family transcriptional regulator, cyclic AMP receptor protein
MDCHGRGHCIPRAVTVHDGALRASRLFGAMPAAFIAELARSAARKRFVRGEYLWRAGQEASAFTVITTGLVKICQPTRDGGHSIVALFGARESVGDVAVVSRVPYPADAIAASDVVEVLTLPKGPVLAAMERDTAVTLAVQRSLLEHSQALRDKIRIMTAGPVDGRLAILLLHLAERFGDDADDGVSVPVVLSRAELACLVGATVETTIRFMSRWHKEGLVTTSDDGFVLHRPEQLKHMGVTRNTFPQEAR